MSKDYLLDFIFEVHSMEELVEAYFNGIER
jgi:hypothetical protein